MRAVVPLLLALLSAGCVQRNPALLAAPRLHPPGPVTIDAERVRLDCCDADQPRCALRARYRLSNPSAQTAKRVAVLFHRYAADWTVEVGGSPVRLLAAGEMPPLAALQAASRAWERSMCQGPPQPFDYSRVPVQCWELCELEGRGAPAWQAAVCDCPPVALHRSGCVRDPLGLWLEALELRAVAFRLELAAGASRTVTVRARVRPGPERAPSIELSPAHVRHFALIGPGLDDCAVRGERRCGVDLSYLPASLAAAAGHELDFALRWPAAWRGSGGSDPLRHPSRPVGDPARPWEPARQAETASGRWRSEGRQLSRVTAHLEPEAPLFHPGGPLLAAGGRPGRSDDWFRARLGYELARPSWLLYSAQLETDFQRLLSLAPLMQAALPSYWIIPSLGLGAGPLFLITPGFDFGARIQANAQWPLLGLLVAYDYLPAHPDLSGLSLFLVLSL